MSVPVIKAAANHNPTAHAIVKNLESIALMETAMSHILEAESDKIEFVISRDCVTFAELVAINESVKDMATIIAGLEAQLIRKIELVCDLI